MAPVSVAVQSKAVYGHSSAEIVGSNPTRGKDACHECSVVSGRALCDKLITCPEESYRMWWVIECDLETLWMRRPRPTGGAVAPNNKKYVNPYPTAFLYGNGMVLHFYQQQESSTTKTVHKVINKGLKTYV